MNNKTEPLEPPVTIDQAKILKELGFDLPVIDFYCTTEGKLQLDEDLGRYDYNGGKVEGLGPYAPYYSAPLITTALAWCRVKYGVHGYVRNNRIDWSHWKFVIQIKNDRFITSNSYNSHNEAQTALLTAELQECVKIKENEQKT